MEPRIKKLGRLETFSFRIDVSVEWDGCRVAQVGGDQVVAALLHALQRNLGGAPAEINNKLKIFLQSLQWLCLPRHTSYKPRAAGNVGPSPWQTCKHCLTKLSPLEIRTMVYKDHHWLLIESLNGQWRFCGQALEFQVFSRIMINLSFEYSTPHFERCKTSLTGLVSCPRILKMKSFCVLSQAAEALVR